jgi:hypothetical protein
MACAAGGSPARRCSPASRLRSASRRAPAGAGWPCRPTRPPPHSARSSAATSSQAPASSPTAGSATTAWPAWDMPTSGATRRPPPAAARIPATLPAPGRPPDLLLVQTVAAGDPSRVSGPGAPAGLPERVRLPVQPPSLAQPGNGVLPRAGTRHRARGGRSHDILAARKPRKTPPLRRGTGHPPGLECPTAHRPRRTAEMQLRFPLRLTAYPGQRFHSTRGPEPATPVLRTRFNFNGRAATG